MSDDEDERLIEADALLMKGDLLGELIIVQCELARGGFDRERGQKLRRREEDLRSYGNKWLAPLRGLVSNPIIRRGFVDEITVDAKTYIAHEAEIWAAAPRLRWVRMTGFSCSSKTRDLYSASPEFHQIQPLLEAAFESGRIRYFEPVDAELTYPYEGEMSIYERSHSFTDYIASWVHANASGRMRGLRFTEATNDTFERLEGFGATLEEVSLSGPKLLEYHAPKSLQQSTLRPRRLGLVSDGAFQWVMSIPIMDHVVELELGRLKGSRVQVPSSVRRLRAKCQYPQHHLHQILASPGLSSVEELVIHGEPVSHGRAEVDLAKLGDDAQLDALRVLRLEYMTAKNLDAFLASPFAQRLELFDLDGWLIFP